MSEERWDRIKYLLHEAMQLAPAQRAQYLDEACPTEDSCRSEIESLLAADADARSDFLLSHSSGGLAVRNRVTTGLSPGTLFEQRFRLKEVLGEGGMGQVWLAEQIDPVRRLVALKLIKAGMYDDLVVQRFQYERQSLAMMDHPAIAKVFEAGATPQGQPFFVMEYVPGCPITDYCDQRRLPVQARLDIFIQACDGVQHAHQRAIIHSDLKPANILVVDVDDKPVPRIIDFGLAKAVTPKLLGASDYTLFGQFVGTPGYMSPEQADPDVQDIDVRTDVYSLGVLLYVLLTGCRPFDEQPGVRMPPDMLLRKLREEDPPRPSTKVAMDRASSVACAAARGTEPRHLAQQLRGDLDWITVKALERDRGRRYSTPSELAADLRHYLNNEPVTARPASTAYRLRKFARRHRVAAGIATGLVLLLTTFSVLQGLELRRTTLERDRANQERDRANRERDRATRITDFMTGMFKVSDPSEARGNSITAREILDKASKEIGKGLAQDAEVQSQMLYVMASTYMNLGLYARSHELSKRTLDARRSLYGPDDPRTLESMSQLGWLLDREGHYSDAEKLEREALDDERRVLAPDAPLALESMDHLVVIEDDEAHYPDAADLARQTIQIAARTLGPESVQTLQYTNHFAAALLYQAQYAEAERQYRSLVAAEERVLGPDHPQTLSAATNLALAVADQGRTAEAEELYRKALSAKERVLGPEHESTVMTMENLAALLSDAGHLSEAEMLHRQALEIRTRTLGPEHPDTLSCKDNLADTLLKEGRVREADQLQRETLAVEQRVLGPDDPATIVSRSNLAGILLSERNYAEAEKLAADTLNVQVRVLGQGDRYTIDTLRILGKAMAHTQHYAEATRLFRETIAKLDNDSEQEHRWAVWYAFACVAATASRPEEALRYLREAVNRGYTGGDGLMAEKDFTTLRRNTQFQRLAESLQVADSREEK